MKDKYYTYSGIVYRYCDLYYFIDIFKQPLDVHNVKEKINTILSNDEKLEFQNWILLHSPNTLHSLGIHKFLISKCNVYINFKVSTIALIALILDIEVTNGIASFILAATGVNIRSIAKINESIGEKCVLLEIYRNDRHKTKLSTLKNMFCRECINNDMNCKYRIQGMCTIDSEKINEILENLKDKNVIVKENDFYKFIF